MEIHIQKRINYKKLLFCIALDLVGMMTMMISFADIIWAPISSIIILKMFKLGIKGKTAAVISFFEEILPYTDIIPTFTIFWLFETFFEKK